jgi:hypothetical protein
LRSCRPTMPIADSARVTADVPVLPSTRWPPGSVLS